MFVEKVTVSFKDSSKPDARIELDLDGETRLNKDFFVIENDKKHYHFSADAIHSIIFESRY